VARFENDIRWLDLHAEDRIPRMLDRAETARRIGTDFYTAAYFEPRGAGMHPLNYCLGLAESLAKRGVPIYCDTPVAEWHVDGPRVVLYANGRRVTASQVIFAANAHSGMTAAGAQIKRRIVPMVSSVIVTEALPESLRVRLLPEGNLVTDAKRLTNYFRLLQDGRLFFGGRGGARSEANASVYSRLQQDMLAILPELRGIKAAYRWSGHVAVTRDGLPHIGSLNERTFYALGYNGRGVALSALMGKMLAQRVCGEAIALGPMTDEPFRPIPFHSLRVPGKQVAIAYYRVLDAMGL
jgi:glycine/D-amino acid oxidase-like deaminating enzyme